MLWTTFRGQMLVAIIFVAVIAALLVAAGWILIRALYRKLTGRPAPRRWRWARRAVVAAAAVGLACVAYGYFLEPYWLEVTHVRITSPKLAPGSRPIRIVHFSDLHCEDRPHLEQRVVEVIAELKPDIIAFTGDAANSRAGMQRFRQCASRLATVAPTFVVQGNWDLWQEMDDYVAGTGATELTGQAVKLEVGGSEVWLVGAAVGQWDKVERALATVPTSALSIVLYHYPDEVRRAAAAGADLYLAGHTHGGQVALPFYGAMVTLSRHGKTFERGLHRVGKTTLYVNRGIGMEGSIVPRIRFMARPEVAVIEICPG